ncbi:MAG: serine/threonine protein kinase [Planctomycetes bacterium]|nr:serine/threonine protein kinase [Planctomycetota bacterium]
MSVSDNGSTRPQAPDPDRTVAQEHGATRTLAPDPRAPAGPAVTVEGFEILSTLGRGGMGVVYKATQSGLNRTVALKMLLAGPFADAALRARFLLEAESVAALEHPNVVRVYSFGESGGHPYLAMEFVPGGTLAELVKSSGPLPAGRATALVAKLASAVAHAHAHGVVHRDIKPLNVLLSAEGEPRLTDFGLAKVGRADQNLSATGQVLGTPAYMAPEQAAGKVREVGTAADVYALGAVMYDVLTGRPPFLGDSVAVTLQKVPTEEPARPRKLNAAIPADLETICLKCLEKVPAKRYPTAQALADDLLRYARNEPIGARPTGALERTTKWVRRNKVIAGALAAVTLAVLAGGGLSLAFGFEARAQAKEAKKQKEEADAATAREEREKLDAVRARNELKGANDELTRAQERVSRTLAQALLGPVLANSNGGELSSYEQEAFWRVAGARREPVAWLFLEEAVRTPLTCKQLQGRTDYSLHAALGLDGARRRAAEELLLARMRAPGTSRETAHGLALALARLGGITTEAATAAVRALTAPLDGTTGAPHAPDYFHALTALAPLLAPADAAAAARVLDERFVKIGYVPDHLAGARAALGARGGPGEVAKARADLVAAARGELAKPMEADAHHLWTRLLPIVIHDTAPAELPGYARMIVSEIAKPRDPSIRVMWVDCLALVTDRLPAAEAAKFTTEATRAVGASFDKERDPAVREVLAGVFAALAARAEHAECEKVARKWTDAVAKEADPLARRDYAVVVRGVAPRVGPAEAGRTARVLTGLLASETDQGAHQMMAEALARLGHRLDPADARHVAEQIVVMLAKESNGDQNRDRFLAACFVAAADRLDAATARKLTAQAVRIVADGIEKEPLLFVQFQAVAITTLASRLEPAHARTVCTGAARAFVGALPTCPEQHRVGLAEALVVLAPYLAPSEAEKVSALALPPLADAFRRYDDYYHHQELAALMATACSFLDVPAASGTARFVVDTFQKQGELDREQAARLRAILLRLPFAQAEQARRHLHHRLLRDAVQRTAVAAAAAPALSAAAATAPGTRPCRVVEAPVLRRGGAAGRTRRTRVHLQAALQRSVGVCGVRAEAPATARPVHPAHALGREPVSGHRAACG